MTNYDDSYRIRAIARALALGIKPAAREFQVARNTIKRWIRIHRQAKAPSSASVRRHHARKPAVLEAIVVSLKERNPGHSLTTIQEVLREKEGVVLSINGIHRILTRAGIAGTNLLPLRSEENTDMRTGMKLCNILLSTNRTRKAAKVLNLLPALSDFSILENIPPRFLSLRRRVEQLELLIDTMPPDTVYQKALELRRQCEKKRLFITAIFTATMEMHALNRLGHTAKLVFLYRRYLRYLPRLQPALKYTFLMECFIAYTNAPHEFPGESFRRLPGALERFCSKLPEKLRIHWYDALCACFQIRGQINESLKWMERLMLIVSEEERKKYVAGYASLLATMGRYSAVFGFDASPVDKAIRSSLLLSLSMGNALLGTGEPKKAIAVALDAFSRAEEDHLRPAMAGFSFFIACCYAALKETAAAKRYLRMACRYAGKTRKTEQTYSLLVTGEPTPLIHTIDKRTLILNHYLSACKSLRMRHYTETYRIAEKNGLLGFLHRIVLIRPEAVLKLLSKGRATFLPREYLMLPVFKGETPVFHLLLLRERESVLYGKRRIDISVNSKDFHLLVYLFLSRKRILQREELAGIFYGRTKNPARSLIKAVSRIRRTTGLPKVLLKTRKGGLLFDVETRIDLEEFEERFGLGKILEKAGESSNALKEYEACLALYKHSPFGQMGYYYNFAEERRNSVRSMYQTVCEKVLLHAKRHGERNLVRAITAKLKHEQLSVS